MILIYNRYCKSGNKYMETVRIAKRVYQEIMDTIGKYPHETGGVLGVKDGTVCQYFFDKKSIGKDDTYSPDVYSINKIISEWKREGIKYAGMIHSHPGNMKKLSYADIYYANKQMECNNMSDILFPLVVMDVDVQLYMYKIDCVDGVKECMVTILDV